MDPRVLAFEGPGGARVHHLPVKVATLRWEDLPERVDWLLVDMNVEPRVSLFAVDRLATRMRDTLSGVVLTIKLNQWRMAEEIPLMLEHVRAMGMARAVAAQLSSNRQEILIYGLTPRGLARPTA
jgi:hypothetical protein